MWNEQDELEIEWNSQFDYVSEAFGATARDCNAMALSDCEEYARELAEFIGPVKPYDPPVDEIPF